MTNAPVVDTSVEDDALDILNGLRSQGLDVSGLSEMAGDDGKKNGADVMVTVYHAVDGHAWTGPYYMTSGEGGANSLLKYRFTAEDVRLGNCPPEMLNQRVWLAKKPELPEDTANVRCRFSIYADDATKEKIAAQGFTSFCRKDVKFANAERENNHVQKRHPRYFEFGKTVEVRAIEAERAAREERRDEALMALVAQLVESKAATPAKSKE